MWVGYLHGDLLDQVPLVGVIEGNTVLRSLVHHQLPQHGALLSDLFGQTAGVNAWSKWKIFKCCCWSFCTGISDRFVHYFTYLNTHSTKLDKTDLFPILKHLY